MIYAAISADIVSSTSLCIEETVALKQRIENLFSILKNAFPGFWGRLIKGDYIECLPDLTGLVGASEYRLTAYGEKVLLDD